MKMTAQKIDFFGVERVENGYLFRLMRGEQAVIYISSSIEEAQSMAEHFIILLMQPLGPAPKPPQQVVDASEDDGDDLL